jgi:hypothetical protein
MDAGSHSYTDIDTACDGRQTDSTNPTDTSDDQEPPRNASGKHVTPALVAPSSAPRRLAEGDKKAGSELRARDTTPRSAVGVC